MNKEWYERKKKEAQHDIEVAAQMTCRFIEEDKNLYDADKKYLIQLIDCKYLSSNDFTWLVDTLNNILERKPNFLEEYGEWCRTIIKNFKGKVRFKIICRNEERDNEKFNMWNYEVRVEGEGINSVTGDDIQFITSQTGL